MLKVFKTVLWTISLPIHFGKWKLNSRKRKGELPEKIIVGRLVLKPGYTEKQYKKDLIKSLGKDLNRVIGYVAEDLHILILYDLFWTSMDTVQEYEESTVSISMLIDSAIDSNGLAKNTILFLSSEVALAELENSKCLHFHNEDITKHIYNRYEQEKREKLVTKASKIIQAERDLDECPRCESEFEMDVDGECTNCGHEFLDEKEMEELFKKIA